MKKLVLTLTSVLYLGASAYAGMFSNSPPPDFMGLPIEAMNDHYDKVRFSVQELEIYFKKIGEVSWEKSKDDEWIMRVNAKDKVSDQRTKLNWVFTKGKGQALPTRLNIDGQEADQGTLMTVLVGPATEIGKKVQKTPKKKK